MKYPIISIVAIVNETGTENGKLLVEDGEWDDYKTDRISHEIDTNDLSDIVI